MNNRDPFSLRRTGPAFQLLQSGAASLSTRAVQVSQQAAAASAEAAATVRKAVKEVVFGPNAAMSTHRHTDNWSSAQSRHSVNENSNGSLTDKISDVFGSDRKQSLPMYKDKPYAYPGGRRKMPWFRRKRVFALILASFAGLSWWFGILSPLSYMTGASETAAPKKSKSSWSLFGDSSIDWDARAEKVKDAFRLSFADYEKHAWGMCRVWLSDRNVRRNVLNDAQVTMSIIR
jgi:endoplasmic reticulum Man9GlcNAc2 1,2-alpha-mannosidase